MKTARFWTMANRCGLVKLSVKEGQALHWGFRCRTSEGWESIMCEWSFDGIKVSRQWLSDGVDCDGRLSRYGADECEYGKLKHYAPSIQDEEARKDGVTFPAWTEVEREQRDYAAEAMGY